MERFHVIEDAAVILRNKGVYRQVKVYRRADALYAALGGGFIRLYANGGTGLPFVSWDDIDVGGLSGADLVPDVHGKLSLPGALKQIEGGKK